MASGSILACLKAREITKLKDQVVQLLQSCDGCRMDISRFRKEYKDYYSKEFFEQYPKLKNNKLTDVMKELNDVISLEKRNVSGFNIVLKLEDESLHTPAKNDSRSSRKHSKRLVSVSEDDCQEFDSRIPTGPSVSTASATSTPKSKIERKAEKTVLPSPVLPLLYPSPSTGLNHCQSAKVARITQPSFSEIMRQQEEEEEERLADDASSCPPIGYERCLKEVQVTPSTAKKNARVSSPPEYPSHGGRLRKTGTPGPMEKSFEQSQEILSSVKITTSKHIPPVEVNRAAENIIASLSDGGEFVSLEKVKAKLCKQFGKSSVNALGFKKDKDIPALNDLIQLQNKVSLYIHAYVMCNSVATLHELGQSLADLASKQDFEDLKLGPLLKQPVVYDMFKAPSSLDSLPQITTIQILKHLERYMTRENLWREKVDLGEFIQYLCEEYGCETPYELGVRIQSVGLAISVIKTAKRSESERRKAVREQFAIDLDEEIERHLRKIKRDLLGQDLGDHRSCVMKMINTLASPVDAMNAIFECCLECFEGKRQKQITNFLAAITGDALGRRLFQLALYVSCKRLVGDALDHLVREEVEKQVASKLKDVTETEEKRPVPPSEGSVVDEVKAWLANADNVDLARLAIIEANVVSKYPDFGNFENLGNSSFLKFLTSHKELLEAIEQVGGLTMVRSGRQGTRLGHQVSLIGVLDFISQCGLQTSSEIIEQNICNYYGISKVTDLGFGSCSNLKKKAFDRREKITGSSATSVVYEAALMSHEPCTKDSEGGQLEAQRGSILGFMSKEDAIAAIQSTPLLEDVSLWTHWDDVFGGEVSKLGDLKSFLENEGILTNAGKYSPGKNGSLVVMETSPGVLLRVTTDTSPEIFKECACRGDAVGAAGHLVSMVMMNGGVSNTPVALLANHVQSSLASMAALEGPDRRCNFVLECLVRMPSKLAQTVGTKVFLEPLKKLIGLTEAPSLLLLSCSTHSQRSRLHRLGFVLGINQWIEDFQNRVWPSSEKEELAFNLGVDEEEFPKRPIAVVNPVQSPRRKTEEAEGSVRTPEDNMAVSLSEARTNEDDGDDSERDFEEDEEAVLDADSNSLTQLAFASEQQEKCRAVIEQIRRDEFGIGLDLGEKGSKLFQRQMEREGRELERLSIELYSRDTHFVLELVQNADDNSYPEDESVAALPSLVFVLEKDKIVVLNNEVGFMEKNIRALCDVGKSTKGAHRYGYIGQKGIGFKSVFRVSDCPEVHSNGYHIRFDAKSGPIGYILPKWIGEGHGADADEFDGVTDTEDEKQEDASSSEYDRWSTRIVLPLKEEHQGMEKSSLAARFRDVHPSLLLFLHRLRVIHIIDQVNNTSLEMTRRDLGNNIMELSHTRGKDRWLVIKKELDASHIQTKVNVEVTELALAFPLFRDADQETSLGRRHQTLPQQNVFAYLPLRSYGFRFIIQGDFEVPSSRENVDSDKPWNQWLREEIPQLFVEALSVFMDHPSFSGLSSVASYFQFVPLEEEILDFFSPVARHILTLLQGKPCIPVQMTEQETSSYNWVLPSQAIFCQACTTRDLITPALLEEHLGLRYMHSEIAQSLNPTLRSRLGIETLSSKHLLEIAKAEVKTFAVETDASASKNDEQSTDVAKIGWLARWLQCMFKCLGQERNSSQDTLDSIASLDVIPLTNGTFVNLKEDSVFLPLSMDQSSVGPVSKKTKSTSSDKTCHSILETDLSTVHPVLFSSLDDIGRTQVEQLLRRLGVKTWSAKDLINSHIIPTFKSDKWKAKSEKVLRSYVVYILEQRLSDPSVCDIKELRSCVQILTNKGPLNPVETPVHYASSFGNPIDLAKELPSISWTLVDESYLNSGTGSKARVTDWKAFLSELGVQTFLSIRKKRVKLDRSTMADSPWSSYTSIWQTTPDGLYFVDDWFCKEFEEFLNKVCEPGAANRIGKDESKLLAQYIDERWENEYGQYANGCVHVKDSKGHDLGETKSSFYLNLVFKPWMSASGVSKRLFIPKDLFVRSDFVYKLLEEHVRYASADLKSDAFRSILRIRESLSVDGLISEMKSWASAQSEEAVEKRQPQGFMTSVAHMSEVYSFLSWRMSQSEDEKMQITEAFRKNALIFLPRLDRDSPAFKETHIKKPLQGSFCLKKDVCWREPTGVASKYFKDHSKVSTRRLLQGYYHRSSPRHSLAQFFIDQLNVDETPNVEEYIEMASTVAEESSFPTPSALSDMLKIFSVLGRKCIPQSQNDNVHLGSEIDENMANFLKKSLERDDRIIFPSSGKWISLSDKPLMGDEKSLVKIFQNFKEKDFEQEEEKKGGVYFLDLGGLLQPQQQRSSRNRREEQQERDELRKNVSLFLRICEVKSLSECVKKEFIPTLVQYQCVPLQRHFHQLLPHVQRFLYFKNADVYDELKSQGFAQKLFEMQFASVESLETVYSLSTHPHIRIAIEEKSGVQTVGSSFCLYVVKNSLENPDVLNTEMVELLLGEKKVGSPELHSFLAALRNYNDLDFFLEDIQNLEPLPDEEEPWCVPPPEEPPEPEEEPPTEESHAVSTDLPTNRSGDEVLHSWPPKSAAQYDKTRTPDGRNAPENSFIKMWPPPAPPDSVEKNLVEGTTTKPFDGTERLHENGNRDKDEKAEDVQRKNHPPQWSDSVEAPIEGNINDRCNREQFVTAKPPKPTEILPETAVGDIPDSVVVGEVLDASVHYNYPCPGNENILKDVHVVQLNRDPPSGGGGGSSDESQARQILPSHAYLWFEGGVPDLDFEDLEFNGDVKVLPDFVESSNREDIGRWGERCVYEYLLRQAQQLSPGVVEIVWMNEKGNTIVPYDLEIRRRVEGAEKPVVTYVEF
ncbi:uncharacterized protein [Montipora foliosa]|uniref:uncharacterized protein isoform X2 n=1 Tax=Montipora foliosa TaxID=591990 RepID=UPI0035F1804E